MLLVLSLPTKILSSNLNRRPIFSTLRAMHGWQDGAAISISQENDLSYLGSESKRYLASSIIAIPSESHKDYHFPNENTGLPGEQGFLVDILWLPQKGSVSWNETAHSPPLCLAPLFNRTGYTGLKIRSDF